eukprot:CAMPEP_0182439766 /NCGR_PEP_ID=MMETSP1167-20130531/86632_1 /TAXON_ID=2988 /ORGANISM="Mallomonas Sp, Strain CCMP3275" /LENGTH=3836 /DNA_ID=CAMNT_0024633535 /DNA_START=462 /DNA_END=11972 /DNA_ORIENTATION=-
MSHTAWATGVSFINIRSYNQYLSDFHITMGGKEPEIIGGSTGYVNETMVPIGDHYVEIGEEEELNVDVFDSLYDREKLVFYRPPEDMTGGYHNLSVTLQNDFSEGSASTGRARMGDIKKYSSVYEYFYNFDSTMSGTVFSVMLFPVITHVTPAVGSLTGGTQVTIKGFGFSKDLERLTVYAGGKLCDVTSATQYKVFCTTRAGHDDLLSLLTPSQTFKDPGLVLDTPRGYGSPGWWMKMWDYEDGKLSQVGDDDHVKWSFPWRDRMYISLSQQYSRDWPSEVGWDSKLSYSPDYYYGDIATVFTAPLTGYYWFYVCADDVGELFMSHTRVGEDEISIATNPSWCYDGNFWNYESQMSMSIKLEKKERLYLRMRTENHRRTDLSQIAVKIKPEVDSFGLMSDNWQPTMFPTGVPTGRPTSHPSRPTVSPTSTPTAEPTFKPTSEPSEVPTLRPSHTKKPSRKPRTRRPSRAPKTRKPSNFPKTKRPSKAPRTKRPSRAPKTRRPTNMPVTSKPTPFPTHEPTSEPTFEPTVAPTLEPTAAPTDEPTAEPSFAPTLEPTHDPTPEPTSDQLEAEGKSLDRDLEETEEDEEDFEAFIFPTSAPTDMTEIFPEQLLQHHSLREIQVAALSYPYYYETQKLRIYNATGGSYKLTVQDRVSTESISFSDRTWEIRNALNSANYKIPYHKRLCSYFRVDGVATAGYIDIEIEFKASGLVQPLLKIIDTNLEGDDMTSSVTRIREHSMMPSGTFKLSLPSGNTTDLAYDVRDHHVRDAILAVEKDCNIEVSRGGSKYTGYAWSVTFIIPRGDFPDISIDASNIVSEESLGYVETLQDGDERVLWFETIPVWMTEVPVAWATPGSSGSNVELFVETKAGDTVKAVCGGQSTSASGFEGHTGGLESDCFFSYMANATAVVTNYAKYPLDRQIERIEIIGSGFLLGGTNTVSVTIAEDFLCEVSSVTDTFIECNVSDVPWGHHTVKVNINGYGHAVSTTNETLYFEQTVYSFFPVSGSFAGGQVLTVVGRGFRSSAVITVGGSSCNVLSWSTSKLTCLTPATSDSIAALTPSSVEVTVDGMSAAMSYTYASSSTPRVTHVSPNELSAAITSMLLITGEKFLENTTVTIGQQKCEVRSMSISSISCMLVRHAATALDHMVSVTVHVPGYGYAGTESASNRLPTVSRGFEVVSVSPQYGSLNGGNTLEINGFGFHAGHPERHTVVLSKTSVLIDSFTELLLDLGYYAGTDYSISCDVKSVTSTGILCDIPRGHYGDIDASFIISVSLNGVTAASSRPTNSTFRQLVGTTPFLNAASITSISSEGVVSLDVEGLLLNRGDLVVSAESLFGSVACTTSSVTASGAVIICPNLVAGAHKLTGYVSGLGYASSTAEFSFNATIEAVSSPTSVGSLAGGTPIVISGIGFAPECENNSVSIFLTGISEPQSLSVEKFLSCSSNEITFLTPAADYYVLGSSWATQRPIISSVKIAVGGTTGAYDKAVLTMNSDATPKSRLYTYSGYSGYTMKMRITIPQNTSIESSTIEVGNKPCDITYVETLEAGYVEWQCTIPPLPYSRSRHAVQALTWPFGYAQNTYDWRGRVPYYNSLLSASLPDKVKTTSIGGGSQLSIVGKGLSAEAVVTVCGQLCPLISASYENYNCSIPAVTTFSSIEYYANLGLKRDLITKITGEPDTTRNHRWIDSRPFDDDYLTYYYDSNPDCYIGIDLDPGFIAQPFRMRFYPRIQYSSLINGISFEGSVDGGETFEILGSASTAHEGWNFIEVTGNASTEWYNAFRLRNTNPTYSRYGYCLLAEVQFLGVTALNTSECNVIGELDRQTASLGQVIFDTVSYTPVVTSLNPTNGTALGGTLLTIEGMNFNSLEGFFAPSVSISGVTCAIKSWSANQITCITGPRHPNQILPTSLHVDVIGRGHAISSDDAKFLYIDRWSDVSSWKNEEPPVEGDLVWVPEGQVIMLDVNTPVLAGLLIEGSLYFDTEKDITLDSTYIFVKGGILQIGTHEAPYERQATITLHGDRYKTIELPHIGSKVLAVSSKDISHSHTDTGSHHPGKDTGQLEIHGQRRLRTWTKLAETAIAGDNFIITSEKVDFAPGESLVLPGTEIPEDIYSAEGFGIDEVIVLANPDGYHINFTTPLKFTHRSEIVNIEGRTIDLRSEVGLLSRNIIIQGDDRSEAQLFGVHTVAIHSGIMRIENTEIRKCGQAFNFGRYCTHSHMAGSMEGSYIKANSIHHSFQRAVTTHDTWNWEVRDNVAYNIMGHAYFVEDGTEHDNSITGNLGVYIKRSSALLGSDTKPAAFWTSTPANYWMSNVGVNSMGQGFWFELPSTFGDDDNRVCPVHGHLGQFFNNTGRGNADKGFRIYPQYTPLVDECDLESGPAPQYMYETTLYRNRGDGLFSKEYGDIHQIDSNFLENGGSEVKISKHTHVNYTHNPKLKDCILVGRLDDRYTDDMDLRRVAMKFPQGEFFSVEGIKFVNYGRTPLISGCASCSSGENFRQGGFTYRTSRLEFIRSTNILEWEPNYKEIFLDEDGTMAGQPHSWLLKWQDFNDWPECVKLPSSAFEDTMLCDNTTTVRRFQIDGVTPEEYLSWTDLTVSSSSGSGEVSFFPLDSFGWVVSLVTGHHYSFQWAEAGVSAREFTYIFGEQQYLEESMALGRVEDVAISYTSYKHDFEAQRYVITYGNEKLDSDFRNAPLSLGHENMAANRYFNNTITTILSTKGANLTTDEPFGLYGYATLCPATGCFTPLMSDELTKSLWSDSSSWAGGKIPLEGEDAIINGTRWIVMDVIPPKLNCLRIYGKLTLSPGLNSTISVSCMAVYGVFEIAGENQTSYEGHVNIDLYGAKSSSTPIVVGESRVIGSKVIAVMGSFIAIGQTKTVSWSRLSETAAAGQSTVTLKQSVDWEVGDSVVISPTGYFGSEGELWSDDNGGAEVRNIVSLEVVDTTTVIALDTPLSQTHLCTTVEGESFCGAVGLLSRNVRISSVDAAAVRWGEDHGWGAHVMVIDLVKGIDNVHTSFSGSVMLDSVEFKNMGKLNADSVITFDYNDVSNSSSIKNCAFNDLFSMIIRADNVIGLNVIDNVAYSTSQGGILINKDCTNFVVASNLLVGVNQRPAYLQAQDKYVRPLASFYIYSPYGEVFSNLAAGSNDNGFMIATSMFFQKNGFNACTLTRGEPYVYSLNTILHGRSFWDNEAVACRGGLFVVTMSTSESTASSCAIISGVKAWRSAHYGIMAVDAEANLLAASVVLAENHIGMSMNYFRAAEEAFNGVVASKIIGSLNGENECSDLVDSPWIDKTCSVFSSTDPLGWSRGCSSEIARLYKRVGIMLPQFMNAPRTCATAGRFAVCDPPNTPDRLCNLPWEHRYGLPIDMMYTEMQIHDTVFTNFRNSSCGSHVSPAIAFNPTQVDELPTMVTSGLTWHEVSSVSKLSTNGGWSCDGSQPCMGHIMLIVNDLDATMLGSGTGSQLIFNSPTYTSPSCVTVPQLGYDRGYGFISCPKTFKQYSAHWRDYALQKIGPIQITRRFPGQNRTYATYAPIKDLCPMRSSFSRFPMLLSDATAHKLVTTGTNPSTFYMRWDAPSVNHSTVISIFVTQPKMIDVFTAPSRNGPWSETSRLARRPTTDDPAGASLLHPQERTLSVTLRGGENTRFYRFVTLPEVVITLSMTVDMHHFFAHNFIAHVAALLGISIDRIKWVSVGGDSSSSSSHVHQMKRTNKETEHTNEILSFVITSAFDVTVDDMDTEQQVVELNSVREKFTEIVQTGVIDKLVDGTIYDIVVIQDIIQQTLEDIFEGGNYSFNSTNLFSNLVSKSGALTYHLRDLRPTSMPTFVPTTVPVGTGSPHPDYLI